MQRFNRSMIGAYRKGKQAKLDGLLITDCPYGDYRTYRGSVTWSRAYIRMWEDGYNGYYDQ